MAGLATVFGSGAMTNSIPEIENSDLIFVIGSNTKENHPIIAQKMIKAYRKGARLIIADPRRVPLVRFAHIWMQHRPGTDVALLNSMMHVIVKEDLVDRNFIVFKTEGFEKEFIETIEEYTPEVGEKITGIPKGKIIESARLYATAPRAAIYYTMGITQHSHGTDNVFCIANLAMMTGNLGRESAGVNPLRGQNNVQGATDMGCSPNLYPGYQKVGIASIRERFEALWKTSLSEKEGLAATEMLFAAEAGKLRAMYIMGENPVLSDPEMNHTVRALKGIEFLVVQDIFMTETAALADVVLPAASFAEKDGTFTNTERRVQRVRRAIAPPGDAREDSWIIRELGRRMGYEMKYLDVEEIFKEIGTAWPAMAGISYPRIDSSGLQWPCPTKDHPGTQYLFKGGFPRGRGRFTVVKHRPPAEEPDEAFPLVLTTGRQLFQYHTGTMTRRVAAINTVSPGPYVEINRYDAEELSLEDGTTVEVTSRRGSIKLRALVSERTDKGVVFIPFHFREAAANVLTDCHTLDPLCKIPELKVCAVKITRA
ncbi:formate dehydrogenase H [bacterium BMS3Bbin06]|nr:formate dehydrogenase H [bacterium BMS3Abin08]GBE33615.1 formate dehydrogenase H [bacterium BMS3Bbin06]